MNLRVARKIVKRAGRGVSSSTLLRRAVARWVRWPHRPRSEFQSNSDYGFRWLDDQGRVRPPPPDIIEAGLRWQASRVVVQTETPNGWVSTVFLGLDHQYGAGPPLFFETAVQLPRGDIEVLRRHVSRAAARAFHDVIVATLRAGGSPFLDEAQA